MVNDPSAASESLEEWASNAASAEAEEVLEDENRLHTWEKHWVDYFHHALVALTTKDSRYTHH